MLMHADIAAIDGCLTRRRYNGTPPSVDLHGAVRDSYHLDPWAATDDHVALLRTLAQSRQALSTAVYAVEDVMEIIGYERCWAIGSRGFARASL